MERINPDLGNLRYGYSTGSCAAAAAYAAACILEGKMAPPSVKVSLPESNEIEIPVSYAQGNQQSAEAAVIKDAGDDPDITNGITVVVKITHTEAGDIRFVAGDGVGIITKPGLALPPGEPAINPVPRKMIHDAVRLVCKYPVEITISIPGGRTLAERTFNPRLGINGGLSILGTTGIVRPFSRVAIQETIRYALNIAKEAHVESLFLVPGNIGRRAAFSIFSPNTDAVVEVSNEWGFSLDYASAFGFTHITLVGHPGKLAKLAEGKWDTHSAHSTSAYEYVKDLCRHILSESDISATSTVDGLLQSMDTADRTFIANNIADAVTQAVMRRIGRDIHVCTVLIDLKGNEYGRG